MSIYEAIRELRRSSGMNQQFYATHLKMATRTLQQYEAGVRVPEGKLMYAYIQEAMRLGRIDLYDVLYAAFWEQVGVVNVQLERLIMQPIVGSFEWEAYTALAEVLLGKRPSAPVLRALAATIRARPARETFLAEAGKRGLLGGKKK